MKESQKKQKKLTKQASQRFRKEIIEFAKNYETRPNYANAVHKVQGLAEWYRDLDRQNLTEDAIDAMARHYDNQTISEGRVYVSNNPNHKE